MFVNSLLVLLLWVVLRYIIYEGVTFLVMMTTMRICYFGDYNPDYSRTRTILMGLERNGVEVIHCNAREKGWKKYLRLWQMHKTLRGKYDVLFVGFGDARLMPEFARLITRKPVVWEALFSQYDNWVFDRKLVQPHSLKAYLYWFTDWLGCVVSDLIVLDTHHHREYLTETFGIPQAKLTHVYVGADTTIFFPRERSVRSPNFEVEFHGMFFPMQGADVIVRAAKILEHDGVHFTLIGKGQEAKRVRALAQELAVTNVTFFDFLPQTEIVEYIRNADVCVGLIGGVPRVVRAIPTKVWETGAMERVAINANSASLREVFTPGVDVLGVTPGDPEDLARTIRELKQSGRAEEMGKEARKTVLKFGTPEIIAKQLTDALATHFPELK